MYRLEVHRRGFTVDIDCLAVLLVCCLPVALIKGTRTPHDGKNVGKRENIPAIVVVAVNM